MGGDGLSAEIRETRTLRVEISPRMANLLDQIKMLEGKAKKEVVEEALESYLVSSDHRGR